MDWNDLHLTEGLDEVKRQIEHGIAAANDEKNRAEPDAPPVLDVLPIASYSDEVEDESESLPLPAGWGEFQLNQKIKFCLNNYVLLYQTTNVFDRRMCGEISKAAFEAGVGKAVADAWYDSPKRKAIYRDNLVFDPEGLADPRYTLNLFTGLSVKPRQGDCMDLMDLLFHLCNNDVAAYEWALNWIAYPLQNPGAKMRTAIVIHGREGGGKNLFWSAVEKIYGKYATIITQNELESSFNGWASGKLFIIGNEVVSRQEMFHKKGIIKNLITEPKLQINEKNVPVRYEDNHANMVFFSNVLQPVTPDSGDRRFLILWTPPKLDKSFYKKVADFIHREEGHEIFYQYLLNLDLGGFDEYTEPPMTKAKSDLIELSMKSSDKFLDEWFNDEISGLECQVVHVDDLYRAYRHWCDVNGERFKVPKDELSITADKHEQLERKRHQKYFVNGVEHKGTFIFPATVEQPEGMSKKQWLGEMKEGFAGLLEGWKESNC